MLKKIIFFGFKSFADKVEVDFTEGITAVIGPNGCGKSNIFDGVRWVLGEQSAKTLRGGKMEDVIFSGSDERKPRDFAEVTLVLDNKNKLFRNVEGDEVSVTRRAYRKGGSEYIVNGEPARLKDIHNIFLDTGVGSNSYSMIGQGEIGKILSTKLDERRAIFEEASGIVKLKQQKEQTEKRLNDVDSNMLRIEDIINELEKQLNPLRRQSEKTKEYNELSLELSTIETQYLLHEYDSIHVKIEEAKTESDTLEKDFQSRDSEIEEKESRLSESKSLYQEKNDSLFSIQEQYASLKEEIEKLNGSVNLNNERISNSKKTISDVESNLKEIEENFSLSTEEFNTKQNRLKEITDSLKKKEEELNMLTSKMNGFDSERLKLSNDIEFTRNQSIEEYNELNKLKYELEQAQKRQDEMTSELADIEEKLGSYSDLKKEAENEFSQSKKEYDDTSSEVQSLQNATTTKKEKLKTLKVKLEDSFNSTKQLENEIIRTNDKLENIESFIENNEGFFEGVKSILSLKKDGKMTGVFGAVAELLTVDPAYEKAVEILLQSSMQFLVVENDTIAKKCVEYLKTNKAGRATFLPLNMAQASSLSEQEMSWIKESKGIVPAISAIHFSEEFKDVFASLIGRMVIATDLEVGTAFMKKYNAKVKIATIDGEVIQSGSISGGESKRQKANFFTKRRELDELKKLSETLESSLKSEKENYDKLSNDVQSLEKNVLSLDEKIEELKELLQEKNAFVTESKSKLERLDERFQEFEVQEQELSLNKKELFRQIVNYKMNIEEKGKLHQELTQKLEKAQVDLGHLESKFTEESQAKTDLLLSISTFKEEYRNIEEYLSDFNDDNDSLEDKIKKLYERKESEDNKIKEVVSLLQIQQGQLKTLSEQSTDMNKQIETMRTEISSLQNELNVLESELKEVRKDKEVKEKAWNQKQVYLSRKETELSNVIARLQETYEIEEASIATLERLEIDVAGSKKEIDRIKKRIQALGAINHEAIEQCSELEERYSKEKTQFDDIKQAKHDLMTLLTQVEGEMKERFTKTFNEIAGYFEKTFVDLFEGGRAKLTLVDPSDPLGSAIDIVAQPPGKKPQSINLLSGGEKAFTAVALIFAIITAKPSPFVVLDEVDAPLDDANVARFAYYLREFSKKTQFIIVTHRKGSMMVVADLAESPILNDEGREVSGKIYGVTQVERGCTIMFPHSISELRKKQA